MISEGFNLSKDIAWHVVGQGTLTAGNFPASGSFKDVSAYERFGFLVHVTSGSGSDISATVQQVTADDGTPADLSTDFTSPTLKLDSAADHMIEVDVSHLSDGYKYATLTIAGGNPVGCVVFLGLPKKTDRPVTQANLGEIVLSVG